MLLKEDEKQPLEPTAPSPEDGPDTPTTLRLHVRLSVLTAQRFPETAANRVASRHNRFMRASDILRRLSCTSTVKFRIVYRRIARQVL
jgi:hypothetical protein